jgi:hypothetical protein
MPLFSSQEKTAGKLFWRAELVKISANSNTISSTAAMKFPHFLELRDGFSWCVS